MAVGIRTIILLTCLIDAKVLEVTELMSFNLRLSGKIFIFL